MLRKAEHLSLDQRAARGAAARDRVPPSVHGDWSPGPDRADPVALILEQNATREADLVPIRHGRMVVSPFTFYRGAAKIMATDLDAAPTAGLDVQLCGDAHLSNFGAFASPERILLFDLNDFDETLVGPFEYDVARLAASFVVAARDQAFTAADAQDAATSAIAAYRSAMAGFADMRTLDVWYARLDAEEVVERAITGVSGSRRKLAARAERNLEKTRSRDSLQALSKLTEVVDGKRRIISDPPVLVPERELADTYGFRPDQVHETVLRLLHQYRETLPEERRHLLDRFEFVDLARKVVGVGSVGTRAWIALLQGRDDEDPLFLQIKEATASVLEDHLPPSPYDQPGERVVHGQRMMQAASDLFLGWTRGAEGDRYYYWRQLRDMKGSANIDNLDPPAMRVYADACGWTLARAHARSGDAVAIAAYLGKSDRFDRAMTDFAMRYADRNELDYEAFVAAIRSGRLEAVEGV